MSTMTKIAGITFAVKANQALATARPSGEVSFVRNRKFDTDKKTGVMGPDCLAGIMVMWGAVHVGWIPKGSDIMTAMNELIDQGKTISGRVVDYAYSSGKDNFNNQHIGVLAAMTIEVDVDLPEKEGETEEPEKPVVKKKDNDFEFYERGGKQYRRASDVLEHFVPEDDSFLKKWMIDTFKTHADYKAYMDEAGGLGSIEHDSIETACKLGAIGMSGKDLERIVKSIPQQDFDNIPAGFWNFVTAETQGMTLVGTETTVFDDSCMVAGTYDIALKLGNVLIIPDWKRSKQVSMQHIIKTCFYAHLANADEAWVVAFGSPNKCKYQLKKVKGKAAIAIGYTILKTVAIALSAVTSLKAAMKE